MRPRIAIPVPHAGDPEYAARALPQYERAVEMAGGEPVAIPLDKTPEEIMRIIERCDGVLLPGSKADVDPAKYGAPRHPDTAPADAKRDTVDELLLQDAYNMRKPILGICYGLQILNVYRSGSLLQHIESPLNHAAGRKVAVAHAVEVDPKSLLAEVVASGAEAQTSSGSEVARLKSCPSQFVDDRRPDGRVNTEHHGSGSDPNREGHGFSRAEKAAKELGALAPGGPLIPVNSSHHQSADVIGDSLRVAARCPDDGIIEAVEGTSPDHFVLAVQWHPERSVDDDSHSRAIFRALIEAARARHEKLVGEFEGL
jgi:putative glutamine amidotransferase